MSTGIPTCPFERIEDPDLEARQIDETSALMVTRLQKRYPPSKPIGRGVHPKSHGCVQATFTVNPDIASEYQVGLFAQPGREFGAIVRFSNAAVMDEADIDCTGRTATPATPDEHGSRGMALKVLDVGDEVLALDGEARNQDFLMVNQPVFAFANAKDYLRLQRVLDDHNDIARPFFAPLGALDPTLPQPVREAILKSNKEQQIEADDIKRMAETLTIVRGIQATPVAHPLGIQYFSAAPFLFGPDRVMKFSARPGAEVPPTTVPEPPPRDYLRQVLTETMLRPGTLQFDFMVQVRPGGDDLGIENASSLWNEADHPFVSVARITIAAPQENVYSEEHIAACERLVFTPWHSLAAHQPIGGINRLRKAVYEASANYRLNA
jgi:hypothetical protein